MAQRISPTSKYCCLPARQRGKNWQLLLFTEVLSGLREDCLKVMATLGERGDAVLNVGCRQMTLLEWGLKVSVPNSLLTSQSFFHRGRPCRQ